MAILLSQVSYASILSNIVLFVNHHMDSAQGNSIYFYKFFIYPWTKLFKPFLPERELFSLDLHSLTSQGGKKIAKKKQTTLQVDRFCMASASRKARGSSAPDFQIGCFVPRFFGDFYSVGKYSLRGGAQTER